MIEGGIRAGYGKRPALIVVDITRLLADPNVSEHLECAVSAANQIARLLAVARQTNQPIFFTRGGKYYYLSKGAPHTALERGAWAFKSPLVDNDAEKAELAYQLPDVFGVRPEETVISKSCPSAFFGTMLASYLLRLGVDTLIVTGMHTSACIRATVTDAFSHGLRVILAEECLADRRPEAHHYHLKEMNEKYADVVSVDDIIHYFMTM